MYIFAFSGVHHILNPLGPNEIQLTNTVAHSTQTKNFQKYCKVELGSLVVFRL